MRDLAIVLVTFKPDAALACRGLSSIVQFNRDQVPVFLAVPDEEVSYFKTLVGSTASGVVGQSEFRLPPLEEKIHNYRIGYLEQEFVKLSVHHLGEARNYFILDSDSFFIRAFEESDFIDPMGHGYTVLTQDKDQSADPGYGAFAANRAEKIERIGDYFELPAQPRATCHNSTVLISEALASFEEWRDDRGLTLVDLMRIAVLEFTWYNFFLQRYRPDLVIPIEPLIRMIHTRTEYRSILQRGMDISTLSHSYLGLCVNSGWAGRDQRRVVKRLATGSRLARTRIHGDQLGYLLHQRLDWLRLQRRGVST